MIDRHIWTQLICFVWPKDRHELKLNKLYLAYDRQTHMITSWLALCDRRTDMNLN